MNPMKIFAGRVKAAETSYFKPDQEDIILRRKEQLKADGRLDSVRTRIAAQNHGDVLPEILGHHLPMRAMKDRALKTSDIGYKVFRPTASSIGGAARDFNRPNIYDGLTNMKLGAGRGKWQASNLEGTSLFDANAAQKLMDVERAKAVEKRARLVNVGIKPEAPQVIKLFGVPLRSMPEPTPGRAMFWGTVLCVWLGSATASLMCSQFDIKSAADVQPKMREAMMPMADSFRESAGGIREKVLNDELAMDTGSLAFKLKETLR